MFAALLAALAPIGPSADPFCDRGGEIAAMIGAPGRLQRRRRLFGVERALELRMPGEGRSTNAASGNGSQSPRCSSGQAAFSAAPS